MLPANATPGTPRPGFRTVRSSWFAIRLNVRVLTLSFIALALLVALAVWSISLGSYEIPYADVIRAIAGRGTEDQNFVVQTIRLPRTICAVMIGAALAMWAAVGVMVLSIFTPITLGTWFVVAMIVLMSGFILYETSDVMRTFPTNMHVAAALMLFSSLTTLFWYVLRLTAIMNSDD